MILVIILAVLVLCILWVIGSQKNLVKNDELCNNSLSQIGVQLSSRWDALIALSKTVKNYSEFEYKAIVDIISMRSAINKNSTGNDINKQEGLIEKATSKIMALSESYPELKANELYVKLMDSVNEYENNVRMSRMVYNDCVTKYNFLVRSFPTSLVANMFSFGIKEYLKENENKTDMPEV